MPEWTGGWVSQALGLHLVPGRGHDPSDVERLVGLALRRNPRRAHLLVSRVLGKHIPVRPAEACAAGTELGRRVAEVLSSERGDILVVGFAETATAVGHLVADALDATYVHSTRRRSGPDPFGFDETHSHATRHHLIAPFAVLSLPGTLVLVDDELSTGATAAATVRALHAMVPRRHYVVAALVDARMSTEVLDRLATELGVRIDVTALVTCRATWSGTATPEVAALIAADPPEPTQEGHWAGVTLRADWPAGVPTGASAGFGPESRPAFDAAIQALATRVRAAVPGARSLHVLGTEELMYLPLRLARSLELSSTVIPGAHVTFSSTTRSPVVVLDRPTYAVRSGLCFPAHDDPDDGPGPRFAYNLDPRLDAVVVVLDERSDTPRLTGLLRSLEQVTDQVLPVVVPTDVPVDHGQSRG